MENNIHVLPTDKPSRLFIDIDNDKLTITNNPIGGEHFMNQHIYITSDEEIKEGDWCLCSEELIHKVVEIKSNIGIIRFQDGVTEVLDACKKIILTTDELYIHNDLIPKEYNLFPQYIQKIDDEFLEWFVNNPSCERVEVEKWFDYESNPNTSYKIIIPKEEIKLEDVFNDEKREVVKKLIHEVKSIPAEEILANRCNAYEFLDFDKQETLEEAFDRIFDSIDYILFDFTSFEQGAKWQQKRSYSEEEVLVLLNDCRGENPIDVEKWFEQFKNK